MEKKGENRYVLNIVQTIFNSGVMNFPEAMFNKNASVKEFSIFFEFGDVRYPLNVAAQRSVQTVTGESTFYKGYRTALTVDLLNRISSEFPYSYILNVGKELKGEAVKESMTIKVIPEGKDYIFKVIETEVFEHEVWLKVLPAIRKFVIAEQFDTKKNKEDSGSHKVFLQKFYYDIPISDLRNHTHVKNALYMWADKNRKKVYIGFSTNFAARFTQHKAFVSDPVVCKDYFGSEIDITHFGYWNVRSFVAVGLLKAFEAAIIAIVAAVIPNRSEKITPFVTDTKWQLVNKDYRD